MATTSSQRPSDTLPSSNYSEAEDMVPQADNSCKIDAVTEARPHLAFKASVRLVDMDIDGSDRANRVHDTWSCRIERQRSALTEYENTNFELLNSR